MGKTKVVKPRWYNQGEEKECLQAQFYFLLRLCKKRQILSTTVFVSSFATDRL